MVFAFDFFSNSIKTVMDGDFVWLYMCIYVNMYAYRKYFCKCVYHILF